MRRVLLALVGCVIVVVALALLWRGHDRKTVNSFSTRKLGTDGASRGVLFDNSEGATTNPGPWRYEGVGVTVCLRQSPAEEEKWFATPCRANTADATFKRECKGHIAPPCQPVSVFADSALTKPLSIPFPVGQDGKWQFYMPAGCYKVWLSNLETGEASGPSDAELICSGPAYSRPVIWNEK